MEERIFVGVLRMVCTIPGARSLKERRQAISSITDRVKHRFSVSIHEVDRYELPTRQVLVVTTAGNDRGVLRSVLDQITGFVGRSGKVLLGEVDVEVFRWHPSGGLADLVMPDEDSEE